MNNSLKPVILSLDDDKDTLNLIERYLTDNGFNIFTADTPGKAFDILHKTKVDLILLDVIMPEMNGYEFCNSLRKEGKLASIPVIFLTSLEGEQDKARAFALGAVDYLTKPFKKDNIVAIVKKHLKTLKQWEEFKKERIYADSGIFHPDFKKFRELMIDKLNLQDEKKDKIYAIKPFQIYSISKETGIAHVEIAKLIAEFMNLSYTQLVNPENVQLGVFPAPFCRKNSVVPLSDGAEVQLFVLSNPFNLELMDALEEYSKRGKKIKIFITEPEKIESLFLYPASKVGDNGEIKAKVFESIGGKTADLSEQDMGNYSILYLYNNILETAVSERASDIHIEPKENNTVIRFRIDGDMREVFSIKKETGIKLISRFKVLGGMDITEKRKPQDGASEAVIGNRNFRMRIATTNTPSGESLILRLVEPYAKMKDLNELGMTLDQVNTMEDLGNRNQGLILIIGPTGSGKTTTIYSLLSRIDCKTRSLISVEDPVEYRIPFANQQQVNEKAGITFESLLKSSVRQDPDLLFIGEIRDQSSSKIAMDFASTGRLTITSLHSSNATTAIFRLERLGISRGAMADILLCLIAQRLLKKLCSYCKKIAPISQNEIEMLSPFIEEIPSYVAHPVGCLKCNNTGYYGREGVYEIMKIDPEIGEMIRLEKPIAEIREFARKRGDFLLSNHAAEKVKNLIFSPKDAYEKILVEEIRFEEEKPLKVGYQAEIDGKKAEEMKSILVVEDDKDTQKLIAHILEGHGYNVTIAGDGIEALLYLGKEKFDIILSDVNMPNLDGFRLIEMKSQKGIKTPVIFLTSKSEYEDEIKGFELGAMDYIKKPVQKEILLLRLRSILEKIK